MEDIALDRLARTWGGGSRRGLLGLLATLPMLGGLVALLDPDELDAKGRRKRRNQAHHDRLSAEKKRRKKKHKKRCKPQSVALTCADTCGTVPNNCQKPVDCGPCACDATSCPPPADQCHESFCTELGVCGERPKQDGAACNAGNLCTIEDTCVGGVCQEGPHRICPTLPNPCQQGVCNPQTGECEPTNKDPFTPCDDGDPCTTGDHCNFDGVCEGTPKTCPPDKICCPSGASAGQCKGGDGDFCSSGIGCCSGNCLVIYCIGD
jgi:hypothetical protein